MPDIAIKIGAEAWAAAATKLVEISALPALTAVVGPIAGPAMAAALGAATKTAMSRIYATTNQFEKQIDTILSEPFTTARTTVQEVLSARITTPAELAECDRQLGVAFDGLRRAYTYSLVSKPELCGTIVLYQAVVIALKDGGGAFAAEYVTRLRRLAAHFARQHVAAQTESAELRRASDAIDPARHYEDPRSSYVPADELDYYGHLGQDEEFMAARDQTRKDSLRASSEQLEQQAGQLAKDAEGLASFCDFVLRLAKNREAILTSEKPGDQDAAG